MKYYSIADPSHVVSFEQAVMNGQAPGRSLYFPAAIPVFTPSWWLDFHKKNAHELAYDVMQPFVGEEIPEQILREIVQTTIDFPIPLKQLSDKLFIVELFHGPTLAFKDVGARFMSRCLSYFRRNSDKPITVLVATSGDTGGAVAHGFSGVPGVEVVIFYPKGKVSPFQEHQLLTTASNVRAYAVEGSFDDCQQMVKAAFADQQLQQQKVMTSANSINIARWLPQQLYYFLAMQQWQYQDAPVISVPSGNFGNIAAGILAHQRGLPVEHFIAACNSNDTVPRYLEDGVYQANQTIPTISNAMDVSDPSNFIRILSLLSRKDIPLAQILSAKSYSDELTRETIIQINDEHQYLVDPHTAVGIAAAKDYQLAKQEAKSIVLATAHPIKFSTVLNELPGIMINDTSDETILNRIVIPASEEGWKQVLYT